MTYLRIKKFGAAKLAPALQKLLLLLKLLKLLKLLALLPLPTHHALLPTVRAVVGCFFFVGLIRPAGACKIAKPQTVMKKK